MGAKQHATSDQVASPPPKNYCFAPSLSFLLLCQEVFSFQKAKIYGIFKYKYDTE